VICRMDVVLMILRDDKVALTIGMLTCNFEYDICCTGRCYLELYIQLQLFNTRIVLAYVYQGILRLVSRLIPRLINGWGGEYELVISLFHLHSTLLVFHS